MLKKIRVAAAAFFMIALTLLFLDYTGTVYSYLGWSAKVQLVPAILAGSAVIIIGLLLITLIFGRIYCSAICPLGIFQDVISRITNIGKKNRFSYRPPSKPLVTLRFVILGLFIFALIAHISVLFVLNVLLEPYSAYGRIISLLFGPLYQWGNNILAHFAERADSYAFYSVDVWLKSMAALIAAGLTFVVISIFAWKSGRGYCNTICPVGTLLAVITKFSFIKPPINKEKCNSCGLCAKNCKAGCIDTVNKEVDYLRCVSCCNCFGQCPKNAVSFSLCNPLGAKKMVKTPKTITTEMTKTINNDAGRRSFVSASILFLLACVTRIIGKTYDFDGGLAPLEDKKAPKRETPIIPPGADNIRHFRKHCTGCQLCVSACPNQVLRPSSKINSFMQPQMSFERGYCRPECVKCGHVCPTSAIRPVTTAEKSATQIGYAVWNKDLCVVNTDNVSCDLCSRKCPVGAITQIPKNDEPDSLKIPMIITNRCIGCGACENRCPARPYSAIYVEGVESHRIV